MKTFKELRLEAVMSTWTVTVQKPVNKLKKGDKQTVKARSGFEAINKAMKLWKDPALRAASASFFKITKEGLEEAADPKVAKAVQGLNDLGNKMKGRDQKDVRRIEKLYRSGNNKLFQGAIRALDTDLRDQVKDIFDALGMVDKGVIG